MISEIDLLREDIPRLEKKFGADNLFVGVLKAQLMTLQNPVLQNQQQTPMFEGFMRLTRSLMFNKN